MIQLKFLPSTMLIILASTLSINPVSAQTESVPSSGGMQTQMDMEVQQTPSRLNTQPVPTPQQMERMQMERQLVPTSTEINNTNMVSGRIKSIEGEMVTLEMADGMIKEIRVSRADLIRLYLREGMNISANINDRSMASNITVYQASTTTGTEGIRSSTVETTSTTSTETPTTTTETTRTTVQSTPVNRPVRALW